MSSSSSPLLAKRKLDVCLSFSGVKSFVDGFDRYLCQKGMNTFKSDSWKVTKLGPVDQLILEALGEAKVAVVMVGERKPSIGFLEELVKILEFHEKRSLTLIPIFLTPHPLDVDNIYRMYPKRTQIWKTAITKLSNINSQYSSCRRLVEINNNLEQIKKIVEEIWFMFLSSASSDFSGLVAMDRHLKALHQLLALENVEEVRTIGVWGKSGVGKTTFARYTFEEISRNFHTHIFLENVENMKEKIPSENLEAAKDSTVTTTLDHEGNEITEARYKHRKVLLIADGVNNVEQGKWIAEYANWFAPGSRVIIITQNKSLLVDSGVKHIYEVRSLRYDEALQLFSHFAFKQPYPPSDFEQLAVRAVQLAGFLPLALRLFGLFLTGRGKEEWEAALRKLNAKQGEDIMEVWKLMEAEEDEVILSMDQKGKESI